MRKIREGCGKNWMHFVYKLDNLFRSIRVSNENSSDPKAIHFLTYYNSRIFVRSLCTIQSYVINFQPFMTSFANFHACTNFFELNNPEIEKHYKWTLKRLKLGMISSFHPHSMCKKVERVTAKTGRTSCTNWTNSFGVSGFRTRTHLLVRKD